MTLKNNNARSRPHKGPGFIICDQPPRVGRVQRQIRRRLILSHGGPLQTGDFFSWCYPREKHPKKWQMQHVHRALPRYAVKVGRATTIGRPILWVANPELKSLLGTTVNKSAIYAQSSSDGGAL
jgi:hypothetical protein